MSDLIRYDLLTQQALRSVLRSVLVDAAKKGLPGDHHFYITFNTEADGVRMSDRLRAQYPQEMTIILQHQFWDLAVTDYGFEVGLSFGGVMEKLSIPFDAINGFFDPSVQFGLQFEDVTEGQAQGQVSPANALEKPQDASVEKLKKKRPTAVPVTSKTEMPPAASPLSTAGKPKAETKTEIKTEAKSETQAEPKPDKPISGGGEVVRLDRFRKK